MSEISLLRDLRIIIDQFGTFLQMDVCPDDEDIKFINTFLNKMEVETLMKRFIEYLLPYELQIRNKNKRLFLHNKKIFGDLPEGKVAKFSQLFINENISTENENIIWDYFRTIIGLCNEYKKLKRA